MLCLTYWLFLCLLCSDIHGYGQQRQESLQVEFPDYGQSRQESYDSIEYETSNTCATKNSVDEVVSSVSSLTTSISNKLDQVNEVVQAECDTKTVIKTILSAIQASMSAQIDELKASFDAVATKSDLQTLYSKQVEMALAQVATDDQVANSTMMLQMEFQMIRDQITYKDDFQLVKDAVETSTSTLEYELNLVKRELADLKKSCHGGNVVGQKAVCVHGNDSYQVGSFNIGCNERCECFSNGTMNCQERCNPPYFSVGSFSHDPLCEETPSDSDRCCVTASCTSSRSSSKIHLNDSNILEHGGFMPGGAGPENLLHDNGFWNPNPSPWYVIFDFHHRFTVEGLQLSNFGDVTHDVAEFTLESADNITINNEYKLVTKATNVGKGTNDPQMFTFTPHTGRFWRFNVTKVYSEFQPWIEELTFHGNQAKDLACPPQFSPVGLQCLRVVLGGLLKDKTWLQAQEECQRLGGTLAQLQDTKLLVQHIATDLGRENWKFWVGASFNKVNQTFIWTASGTGVSNWDEGQPDNGGFKLFDRSDEHCVEIQAWNGKYNDQDCDEKRSFVCQAEPLEELTPTIASEQEDQKETLEQTEQVDTGNREQEVQKDTLEQTEQVDTVNREQQEQSNSGYWRNCEEVRRSFLRNSVGGYRGERRNPPSMIREIYPYEHGHNKSVRVYCDERARQGGWTVIQRRGNYSEHMQDFNTHWQEYKDGFGEPDQDHWLGLDAISALTNQGSTELLIILEDFEGVHRFAHYDRFIVHNESTGYKMEVSGYSGDAGDSFSHHSGQQFTTIDVDNDSWDSGNCAYKFGGAWWHRSCHECNLNGRYLNGVHESYAIGINWKAWRGYHYSLKTTKMMIRPRRKKRVNKTKL